MKDCEGHVLEYNECQHVVLVKLNVVQVKRLEMARNKKYHRKLTTNTDSLKQNTNVSVKQQL